jgi:hypothetical protein
MDGRVMPADEQFRRSFERCEIPNDAFHHRDHLRLAWIYILESGPETAAIRVGQSIRRYAEHNGVGRRYHETLSRVWVRILGLAIAETPEAAGFEDLLAARPHLLDKTLPLKHYSPAHLWSDAAREEWLEPDVRAFPG